MQLLTRPREATSRWHYDQAKALIEEAKITSNATLLVYAALEARFSIERCIFEIGIAVRGGSFSPEELRKARARNGLNKFLSGLLGEWRPYFEFSKEVQALIGLHMPEGGIPRFELLQAYITQLSGYCHWIDDPGTTIDAPNAGWFCKGVSYVEEALAQVANTTRCALNVNSLPPEVKGIWESYRDGQIDLRNLRSQLELIEPVLEIRLHQKRKGHVSRCQF